VVVSLPALRSCCFALFYQGTWETRPGVIKVVAGAHNSPAITLESIDAILYAGQGQRVTGCVDAPAESTLSAAYRVEGEPEMEANWHPWVTRGPVVNGKLDLCFVSPEAPLSGMIHLRVAVQAPDGREVFAYSPDAIVLVGTQASCTPSATQCCEVTPPPMAAPAEPPQPNAGAPSAPQGPTAGSAAAVQPTAAQPIAVEADGCAIVPGPKRGPTPAFGWLLAGLLAMHARRRSVPKAR
jgi:hypothetical protein